MTHSERMSSVDTTWLRMDRPTNLMMLVAVWLLEGCQSKYLKFFLGTRRILKEALEAPDPLLVTARLLHPFDAALDRSVALASNGLDYEGVASPIAPGHWNLVIEASLGSERLYRSENKIVVAGAAAD